MSAPGGGGGESESRGCVVSSLSEVFAPLYAAREEGADAVRFVAPGSSPGEKRVVDSASAFLCSAHSPMLKAMLASSFQEAKNREVEISPEFVECWPDVVSFLYGARTRDLTLLDCAYLLKAADYYGMDQLTRLCMDAALAKPLTQRQAIMVLKHAPDDSVLMHYALAIFEDRPEVLFSNKKLWKYASASLVKAFLGRCLTCSEKKIFDAALEWLECSQEPRPERQQRPEREQPPERERRPEKRRKVGEGAAAREAEDSESSEEEEGEESEEEEEEESEEEEALEESEEEEGEDEAEGQEGKKEGLLLPEWLRDFILFEHMKVGELTKCRGHLPMEMYTDCLEVAAGARDAWRPHRNSWKVDSRGRARVCTACGKVDREGKKDGPCPSLPSPKKHTWACVLPGKSARIA